MPQKRLVRQVLLITTTGKWRRNRRRTRWRGYISDFACSCPCVEPAELLEISENRDAFRDLLGLLPPRTSLGIKMIFLVNQTSLFPAPKSASNSKRCSNNINPAKKFWSVFHNCWVYLSNKSVLQAVFVTFLLTKCFGVWSEAVVLVSKKHNILMEEN